MIEPIRVTDDKILQAFKMQYIRADLVFDDMRSHVFHPTYRPLATDLMWQTMRDIGWIAMLLEKYVNWSPKSSYNGDDFKNGLLTCIVAHQKLADTLGTSRSTIQRAFKRLRDLGVIQNQDNAIMPNKASLPIMAIGQWKLHPRHNRRVEVWYLDVAAGCYNNATEAALLEQYAAMREGYFEEEYEEMSLF